MKRRPGWYACGSVLCAAALLPGALFPAGARQPADEAKTYTLERKFEKDRVDRYRITAKVTINGPLTDGAETSIKFQVLMKQTVKEVQDDGVALVASEAEKATVEFGDQETDALAFFPKITQKVDRRLRLLESKAEGNMPPGGLGNNDLLSVFTRAQASFFPSGPVKVGDTWKIEERSDNPKMSISGKGKVVKAEKIGDMDTLQLKVTADMTGEEGGGAKSRIDGTANVDIATGRVVRMKGTINVEASTVGKTRAEFDFALVTDREATDRAVGEKRDVR